MPTERSLLLASTVLQGTVALTFGLAFLGMWKGFRRSAARWWAFAWVAYACGVINTAAQIAFGYGVTWGAVAQGILQLPLLWGVMLFHAGAHALTDRDHSVPSRPYVIACGLVGGLVPVAHVVADRRGVNPAFAAFLMPRLLMASAYAWAAGALFRTPKQQWRQGLPLLTGVLILLSLRMLLAAGFEVWQIAHGSPHQPESLILTIAQISLLLVFGVATAVVLIEVEHAEAVRAAETIRDTAEALRLSEARLRFVVENSSDVQVLVDAGRRVRYVAPSCERLMGLPPSAFEWRDFLDLLHPEDRDNALKAFERMKQDPTGRRPPTSVRIRHRSGEWLPFDVSGQLVPQDGAEGPSIVLSVRNMTAQRRLESALLQTQRLDSLGRMAGGTAHDVNNMLTAIMGATDLAKEHLAPDSTALPYLTVISEASMRGNTLTQQLLAFARRLPTTPQRFDARARVASLESMVNLVVGRQVQVSIVGDDRALPVQADPSQFDQVIMNLVINARDAMPGGGRLTIWTGVATATPGETSGPAGSLARVAIEDTGSGIPAAILDRIFEPFFTTKVEGRGTGLGLASAYGFARQAGGTLSVESTEGVGTRFLLDLPLVS